MSGTDLSTSDAPANAYGDLGRTDSGICPPGQMGMSCATPLAVNAGCGATELCGTDGSGNGLDDNCNGVVDEGCACTPGKVKRCFLGPPGKRGVGACTDGQMTCYGGEFGTWGACTGSIGPLPEVCDKLDNDCNGCADDGLCCGALLACPAPGDPRIAPVAPYTSLALMGGQFYSGSAASWSWTIVGGPCDKLFSTTTGSPPKQSFSLTGANTQNASARFSLSGDYTVTMTAVGTDGITYSCTWVQHVIGPGVRFELCWDHTGTAAAGGADLDLHVHRSGTTTAWFGSPFGINADDCFYGDCNPDAYVACVPPPPPFPNPCPPTAGTAWGYSASPLAQCAGAPPTNNGNTWTATTANCPNPRLDIDNINAVGKPENTNIDKPTAGQSFRAMVHYYGQDGSASVNNVEEHPIINIYCGGNLKATYGAAPNTLSCPGPTCFNNGAAFGAGLMWRVADVAAIVDAAGNTTDCTVTALHPPAAVSGYWVTNNDTSY